MSSASIRVRGLRKRYHDREVLSGLDFEVAPGTVFGYLGPNGAGKSTTVKILAGLLGDFEGEVEVAGIDVRAKPVEVKRLIGYVPENASLYEALKVDELLLFVARLHDLPDELARQRMRRMLEGFDLAQRMGSRIATLSKGMRQKVLLASALLHDPRIVFLDEPLSGLDVASTILVKELIRALAARGKTIFYCSHVMDVVERVCDRIVILSGGEVVADGSFEELAAKSGEAHLEAIFSELTGGGDGKERATHILSAFEERHD